MKQAILCDWHETRALFPQKVLSGQTGPQLVQALNTQALLQFASSATDRAML